MSEMENFFVEPRNIAVRDLITAIEEKRYLPQPVFQRKYVWDNEKASKLIETILLKMPIPTIYSFQHHIDGKFHIIDGQQRLEAIKKYVAGTYQLKGLRKLSKYNGMCFSQLNQSTQNRILDYILDTKCIQNVSDKKIIYEIFERFNTGVVTLNKQEIRNCVYAGQFNDFIKENCANYKPFTKLISEKNINRMVSEELVVRFFAMYENNNYKQTDINQTINNYYESKQHLDALNNNEFREQTRELERVFKDTIDACSAVFKNNTFKTFRKNKNNNEYGFKAFSTKVFDLQMLCFAELDRLPEIIRHSEEIRREYINFAKKSPYLNAELQTKQDLKTAVRKWQERVGKIIY